MTRYRYCFNLLFVFILSGLWHGANWTYLVWGALHGVYFIFSLVLEPFRRWFISVFDLIKMPILHSAIQSLSVFLLVDIAWIFFRASTLADAYYLITNATRGLSKTLTFSPTMPQSFLNISHYLGVSNFTFLQIAFSVSVLLVFEWLAINTHLLARLRRSPLWVRWSLYNAMILSIIFFGFFGDQPFIYFQF